jgi:hypothetical protein
VRLRSSGVIQIRYILLMKKAQLVEGKSLVIESFYIDAWEPGGSYFEYVTAIVVNYSLEDLIKPIEL